MHLFPPYKKWTVIVKHPAAFEEYLTTKIESGNTNHQATLKGQLNNDGFLVQIKGQPSNQLPPVIRGKLKTNEDASQTLTLNIQSHRNLKYFFIGIAIIFCLLAVFSNIIALIALPLIIIWFLALFFVMHNWALKRTRKELHDIIDNAGRKAIGLKPVTGKATFE